GGGGRGGALGAHAHAALPAAPPGALNHADAARSAPRAGLPVGRLAARGGRGGVVARRVAGRRPRRAAVARPRAAPQQRRRDDGGVRGVLPRPLLPPPPPPRRRRGAARTAGAQAARADPAGPAARPQPRRAGGLRLRAGGLQGRPPSARAALARRAAPARLCVLRLVDGRPRRPLRLRPGERARLPRDAAPPLAPGDPALLRAVARADAAGLGPRRGGLGLRHAARCAPASPPARRAAGAALPRAAPAPR